MRRKIISITIVILITIISFVLGIYIHELGHAVMCAICLKTLPIEFHIGIESYVLIPTCGASDFDMAMISIGSIILPEIIYLLLLLFKNAYIDIIRIFSGCLLYTNIILSIVVLIFGSKDAESYDLVLFQRYLNLDSKIIIISLIVVLLVNIILELKSKAYKRIIEKLDSLI